MKTIQVVVDEPTLAAADREVKRCRSNRSALVREALRAHLNQLAIERAEQRHRSGYAKHPVVPGEFDAWERWAAWPED
jgi:Arc/MetJ-type ribon-helix-helix transcriptional regulator